MWRYILFFALIPLIPTIAEEKGLSMEEKLSRLEQETQATRERSERIVQFYHLEKGETFRDITDVLLASSDVAEEQKQAIQSEGRRIYIFEYPSGPYLVKGYISLIPDGNPHSLLLYLRGGNRTFGIPSPGSDFACARDYTVLCTTYRGGVSEGEDEFGGEDVDDVKNLLDFLPKIEEHLHTPIPYDHLYMMGASRGGMEMFLALTRFPELQQRVEKIVSLCGLVDFRETLKTRPDIKEMCIQDFGYNESENGEEWIRKRDPMDAVALLRHDLPVYIIQAGDDVRVDLQEGYNIVNKLEANGNPVTYLEVPGADHCLFGRQDRVDIILDWLETD